MVHSKTYIFTYFYQQYMVLFTMVPRTKYLVPIYGMIMVVCTYVEYVRKFKRIVEYYYGGP